MESRIATYVGTSEAQVREQVQAVGGQVLYASYSAGDRVEEYTHVGFMEMTGARSEDLKVNHYEEGKRLFVAVVKLAI
ncbi:hypothetical protein [Porphyrobacter sp. ULC335]|jgi:hypothetical protein|uniref:hypothetical protein n=1 Tax=Porphyrobacter sp. ULC335 TaxID=2854260 RepID=UPI00221EE74E|nr:hypothetical protein [Porphyrobacter sp. ULC335]UYV16352.1 hypothetical protein KVF90_03180 [Porphyrobacter sp. ULC335]